MRWLAWSSVALVGLAVSGRSASAGSAQAATQATQATQATGKRASVPPQSSPKAKPTENSRPAELPKPGPFDFRSVLLLELRLQRAAELARNASPASLVAPIVPSERIPASDPFTPRLDDPNVYRSDRWLGLLQRADQYRGSGGFRLAERQYLEILANLRSASASPEALIVMLAHLGEFYLEIRDLARASQRFSEAIALSRSIAGAPPASQQAANAKKAPGPLRVERLRLADQLTRLGQIQLSRQEFTAALATLSEANAIWNESPIQHRFVGSLYASYFLSRALETQNRWADAERVWLSAVKNRETLANSAAQLDALREQAAFYARRGDFQKAAPIAKLALSQARTAKQPELDMPFLDSWLKMDHSQPQYSLHREESDVAMSEIVALDEWRSNGVETAAALLQDPVKPFEFWLDRCADSERAEMLAWLTRRVSLHLSILLDGVPSPQRVAQAYRLLSQIKGRYLSCASATKRAVEYARDNPSVQGALVAGGDRLAQLRAHKARLYISSALDGATLDEAQFFADENVETTLAAALAADPGVHQFDYRAEDLADTLGPHTTLIDFAAWERRDRNDPSRLAREYGAFVLRKGQPLKYVRLGTAAAIDREIEALQGPVLAESSRGLIVKPVQNSSRAPVTPPMDWSPLQRLYTSVFLPLEPLLRESADLLIVPDGLLALAPLSALADASGKSVLDRYTVSYLNSWRDAWPVPAEQQQNASAPVVIGGPDFDVLYPSSTTSLAATASRLAFELLPGAELEGVEVAKRLGLSSDRVLVGARAQEGLVKALIAPKVLHFATHSVPHQRIGLPPRPSVYEFPRLLGIQDPFLQSLVALAGANRAQDGREDGLLTGLEASDLHLLGTDLVVLSSCRSGDGVVVDSQGVLGLRAAFLNAGANAVAMSLWPVRDEASRQFMNLFYAQGAAAAAAPCA